MEYYLWSGVSVSLIGLKYVDITLVVLRGFDLSVCENIDTHSQAL